MERLPKYKWLMQIAIATAKISTCCRIQVGAVIERDGRIISTGYNGSAPGAEHCIDHFGIAQEYTNNLFATKHHEWALRNEIHAEINAIIFAARKGIMIEGSHMYVTHMPCITCSKYIVQAGITRVVYFNDYEGDTDKYIFKDSGVEIIKL